MNIFQEAKQILDKDGKVNALGPYGKSKLTGQEVAQYFRKNKVSDSKIKKAVEVALDLGGAMDIARKEIKKFYGDKILKSKEVQNALKFANEETVNEIFGISQDPRYRAKVMKMLDDEGIKYKKDGRNALIILGVAPKDQKKLLDRIHKEFGMSSYNIIDEGKGSDIFKKYGSIINRLSDKEKDEVIELLYTMNTQSGRRYKEAFGKVKELLNMEYIPEDSDMAINPKTINKSKPMLMKYAKKFGVDLEFGYKGRMPSLLQIKSKSSGAEKNFMSAISKDKQLMKLLDHVEHDIQEGKNLVPAVKKIVDTKGAAKVGGVMIDMFTASMISQIYDKVNDQNKKRMENSNIQTLVNLAQKMMQKNSVEKDGEVISENVYKFLVVNTKTGEIESAGSTLDGRNGANETKKEIERKGKKMQILQLKKKVSDKQMERMLGYTLKQSKIEVGKNATVVEAVSPAQQAAIAISKKEKAGKPGYDKEGKSLKKESVMDTYRQMWEDASDIVEVTDKEINAMKQLSKDAEKIKKNYQKIVNMGDKELKDKKYNKEYEDILKMSQSVLSLIGKLQTQKIINKESLEEKLSKQDLKFMDMMYDKKGNLTDVGKAVMNYKPGDNIRKIVQNLNNKKK